jgi:hypothetical protein
MLYGDVNALPHPRTNNGSLVSCLNKKLCRSLHLSPTHPYNFEFSYSSPSGMIYPVSGKSIFITFDEKI